MRYRGAMHRLIRPHTPSTNNDVSVRPPPAASDLARKELCWDRGLRVEIAHATPNPSKTSTQLSIPAGSAGEGNVRVHVSDNLSEPIIDISRGLCRRTPDGRLYEAEFCQKHKICF